MAVGKTYGYRAGYQPLRSPSYQPKLYGTAGKWSAEAVRTRGTSGATAADLFMGPAQTGPDWAAAFLTAGSNDSAFSDYVKRNHEKFTGPVLEAMLTQANLVDWYKEEQQKKISELTESIAETSADIDLPGALGGGAPAGDAAGSEGADATGGAKAAEPSKGVNITV
ncbi:SGNH/GDSL hydrolase family protein [Chthonobacter rhizosphaerae]|uniref:SGNH/GDSL hydrolase family protein n=1 Tax=Chthonobacter rhizosphaerae TaxID=2735553 RepID=UPI0015EF2D57|nr:SGNH/GDSL hydrolase family protein [Chthonobacter rhizosphaerae]